MPPRFSSGESSPDAAATPDAAQSGGSGKRKPSKGSKDTKKTKKTKKGEDDEGETPDQEHDPLPGCGGDDDDDEEDGPYGLHVDGLLKIDGDEPTTGKACKKPASSRGGAKKKPSSKKRADEAPWLKTM